MARIKIPDSLKKKEMVYGGKTPPEELISAGKDFLSAGRLAEALDLFAAAGDVDGIKKISAQAVSDGDYFLYAAGMKALGEDISRTNGPIATTLEELAKNAEAAGKKAYADKARAVLAGGSVPFAQGDETEEQAGQRVGPEPDVIQETIGHVGHVDGPPERAHGEVDRRTDGKARHHRAQPPNPEEHQQTAERQ